MPQANNLPPLEAAAARELARRGHVGQPPLHPTDQRAEHRAFFRLLYDGQPADINHPADAYTVQALVNALGRP